MHQLSGPPDVEPFFPMDEPEVGDFADMADLIKVIGLPRLLDMMGLDAATRRGIEKMLRERGEDAVIEALASFDPESGRGGAVPAPPSPRRKRKPRQDDDPGVDELFDQLDLF